MNSIKELNAQYKKLQKSEIVYCIELKATNGIHSILNRSMITKIIDLLVSESQKQIKERENETSGCPKNQRRKRRKGLYDMC